VAGEASQHCLRVAFPELGVAFYVGEQECDCACWRAGHYLVILLASLKRTLYQRSPLFTQVPGGDFAAFADYTYPLPTNLCERVADGLSGSSQRGA
jgi:hypothetical protein